MRDQQISKYLLLLIKIRPFRHFASFVLRFDKKSFFLISHTPTSSSLSGAWIFIIFSFIIRSCLVLLRSSFLFFFFFCLSLSFLTLSISFQVSDRGVYSWIVVWFSRETIIYFHTYCTIHTYLILCTYIYRCVCTYLGADCMYSTVHTVEIPPPQK